MGNTFGVWIIVLASIVLSQASGCTDCTVEGTVYKGHSRFQYDEGCNRYRCVCRCNGSWECPARHVINLCQHQPSQPSTVSVSDVPSKESSPTFSFSPDVDDHSCSRCLLNGDKYPGNSYFSFVDECIAFRNCFCYCNGSWVCPEETASRVCFEETPKVPNEAFGSRAENIQLKKQQDLGQLTTGGGDNGSVSLQRNDDAKGNSRVLPKCLNCTAGGKTIKGNNYFEFVEGCRKLSYCTCFCNGTWTCPERFVENICEPDTLETSTTVRPACGSCSVKGRTFPGNGFFQMSDDCIEYTHCACYCDGSWACQEKKPIRNCTRGNTANLIETPESICNHCNVQGKTIHANELFHLTENCIEYRRCVCQCNGSWSCDKDAVRNVCGLPSEADNSTSFCATCNAYGSVFPPNQYFHVKNGCTEYQDCVCHCNGSWYCPKDSTRDVCDKRKGMLLELTGIGDPEVSETRCLSCFAYDKYFRGGNNFDVVYGCTSYRKCVCRCDGSWSCNDRFAINICSNETLKASGSRNLEERTYTTNVNETAASAHLADNQCSFCDARGKVVIGNSLFELTAGCVEYKNCLCRCDGSWECPPQFAKYICNDTYEKELSRTNVNIACSSCIAKGKIIRGGSSFELADGCTLYSSCQCECTGKWNCSTEKVEDVCSGNATVGVDKCSVCQPSPDVVHPPNTWFTLTDDCVQHTCMCFCNGSWSCPADYNRWVCEDKCLQCDVDGQIVPSNTQYVHKTGCLEYTCSCHCNGSWSCPEDATRDTCTQTRSQECKSCHVTGSLIYQGETEFILEQGCLQYKCRCNCDGSYFCPGKEARNVCRGEILGGCRTCVLSDTNIHKGDTDFVLQKGCVFYNCRCHCDGSWHCPAETSRNVCLGEFPGGCRVCRVSDTEMYRASSFFHFRQGCVSYKCRCQCDGSWSCPGRDARDVCKGEVPGGCKSCLISDTEFYRGASYFETTRDCVRYKCRCNCNGSFNCPGETATRVCQAGAQVITPVCRPCTVSATEVFAGNSTFILNRHCFRFECRCMCDGSWECPPEKTFSMCTEDRRDATVSARCKLCRISDKVFPYNSEFKFNRGCFQFSCLCNCSGRWSCDTQNLTNVCSEQAVTERPLVSTGSAVRQAVSIEVPAPIQILSEGSISGNTIMEPDIQVQETDGYRSIISNTSKSINTTVMPDADSRICQPCHVDGKDINVDQEFVLLRGCVEYRTCKCYCNGRWQCAEIKNTCSSNETLTTSEGNDSPLRETSSSRFKRSLTLQTSTRRLTGPSILRGKRAHLKEDGSFSDQGVGDNGNLKRGHKSSESVVKTYHSSSKSFKSSYTCVGCEIRGVSYAKRSKFVLRDGCSQRVCECHCDGSWSCKQSKVDICKVATKDNVQDNCKSCLVDGDVYISERDFHINSQCFQYSCHCFCNGSYDCPAESRRYNCRPDIRSEFQTSNKIVKNTESRVRPTLPAKENEDGIISSQVPGCKYCQEDGKRIQALASFTKKIGCYQVTCFCQCNGIPNCPTSFFQNVCRGPDGTSPNDRKGCRVGERTHYSRVFFHVENCTRRACVCYNDGSWSCRRAANDRQVC
ncbi:unnamed protein product [Candidula unifasciata]|uniref:Uncharacterized protein n=1 Tax=Candidula unifasciata TaxID=100452 RepID=A0A8S3ZY93_9EUPU|nr:unnamed protein product [Candidula unifasciata]